jgi:Cft2 family RNA processing exonuclease
VTAIDAHHCPGAAVLLFELPTGKKYIHCGDMRYHPAMKDNAHLQRCINPDAVMLDTTYCHPKHTFPPQQVSVDAIASLCEQYIAEAVPKCCKAELHCRWVDVITRA